MLITQNKRKMDDRERKGIIELIQQEVVPAIGCTEPIAVALCVARAKELLGAMPDQIEVYLSANMLKNAMGVGIPSTDQIGLPITVALGAIVGKSKYGLEVLKESTPEAVHKANEFVDTADISIELKKGSCDKLFIEVKVYAGDEYAEAVISGSHTHFTYLAKNGVAHLDEKSISKESEVTQLDLNLKKIVEFASSEPYENIQFILESARLNKQAAKAALKSDYGHGVGKMLAMQYRSENPVIGNSVYVKALSATAAATDARMAGAMVQVMSNSGSGNQGISATLPVVVYAEENSKSDEELARALILSHLTAIYIKQSLGRLSALCGCVVAGTGASCGITYLMGGAYKEISFAVQNMIANITGMLCDGAKPSCSLKVATGVSTAVLSALLAMDGKCVTSAEGIVDEDVDQTIQNLTRIGSKGMQETDRVVLDIMTGKKKG